MTKPGSGCDRIGSISDGSDAGLWAVGDLGVWAICALLAFGGCATAPAPGAAPAAAPSPISSEQENQIGAQIKAELEQKQRIPYVTDPAVLSYLRGIANKLIAIGRTDHPDINWQVNVIDDPQTVNAFATAGGYLYIYSGLLAAADDEAELAAVIAHEIGHVTARHPVRSLIAAYSPEAVIALANGQNPGLLTQLGTSIGTSGLTRAHARADETEADERGARYASSAGYDPHALMDFFTSLQKKAGNASVTVAFLSDHPPSPERSSHLEKFVADNHLRGSARGTAALLPVKQRIVAQAAGPSGAEAVQALIAAPAPPPPPPSVGIRPASARTPAAGAAAKTRLRTAPAPRR